MARHAVRAACLVILCVWAYALRPGAVGLMSSQEALRAIPSQEMQRSGEWVVPMLHGEPYIAKPPLMYWGTVAIAELRGTGVGETEVRLCSALGGIAGVVAVYFGALVILRCAGAEDDEQRRARESAAWFAALGLACAFLYVRAARTAAIDVLLVAPVVVGIAAVMRAWRAHEEGAPREADMPVWKRLTTIGPSPLLRWSCALLAGASGAVGALAKGPAPVVVILLAAHGSMIAREVLRPVGGRGWRIAAHAAGWLFAVASGVISSLTVQKWSDGIGVAILAASAWVIGWGAVRAAHPARARAWVVALARTHPVGVAVIGVGAYFVWAELVRARIGADVLGGMTAEEVDNNLNLLVAESPVHNLGFFVYGVAPISLAAIWGIVVLATSRPSWSRAALAPVVWVASGFIVFSALGKGVARYLLPVFPGVAVVGGLWLARLPKLWRTLATAALSLGMVAHGVYYGFLREGHEGDRSPRDLAREIAGRSDVELDRLGTLCASTDVVDFYFGRLLHRWDSRRDEEAFRDFAADARAVGGVWWALVPADHGERAVVALPLLGLRIERVPLTAAWRHGGEEVWLLRAEPVPGGAGGQ